MSYPALTLGATPATLIVSGPWTTAQSASLERLVATSPSIDVRRIDRLALVANGTPQLSPDPAADNARCST